MLSGRRPAQDPGEAGLPAGSAARGPRPERSARAAWRAPPEREETTIGSERLAGSGEEGGEGRTVVPGHPL
jgi:hypothetical protein